MKIASRDVMESLYLRQYLSPTFATTNYVQQVCTIVCDWVSASNSPLGYNEAQTTNLLSNSVLHEWN